MLAGTKSAAVKYADLSIGVPKESMPAEKRVAQTPETVAKLTKEGFKVKVEAGAGALANFSDGMYADAGAEVTDQVAKL